MSDASDVSHVNKCGGAFHTVDVCKYEVMSTQISLQALSWLEIWTKMSDFARIGLVLAIRGHSETGAHR